MESETGPMEVKNVQNKLLRTAFLDKELVESRDKNRTVLPSLLSAFKRYRPQL